MTLSHAAVILNNKALFLGIIFIESFLQCITLYK